MTPHPCASARHIPLFAGDADARRLVATSLLCNAAAYLHLALAAAGLVPGWSLAVTIPILVPRWMIAIHELFHLRGPGELDPLTRLLPLLFSVPALGYRELLDNHRGHHREMASPRDPEYYQLRGSPLAGLANAFTAPEQMWFRWVARRGLDRQLALQTLIRALLAAALVGASGTTFLWYWVPARLSFGLAYFSFFYCLHRRGSSFGVYRLVLPAALLRTATLLWGRDVVEASIHHDVHHAQPRVAAALLGRARELRTRPAADSAPD